MDSSDSLKIDEHLARLLAAYDPGIDGGDGKAPTIGVVPVHPPLPGEHVVKPLSGIRANEGPVQEILPDTRRTQSGWTSQTPTPTPAVQPGPHRIGRFELRRQLGKGGCGIVFLAFDPKLEREVALKIPRPEMLLSPEARRRLVREALAAAEFDHPNLVPVYETGEIGPVCFIATAFCPGQTLGEWLDRQSFPVPIRQAARLLATIAEAVQHAHDRGVLHRDLKPNNVILQATKDDPQEQEPPPGSCPLRGESYIPRVVDFGLAKLIERGGPSDTNTRQILGTPKYMAPEQAQARHDDVGPTADVYALGVILYEMISGRAPYEGASDVEVLRLAIDGNLTNPRHIRSDIPRDLEAICLKAMAKTPARRYRTAIDLSDDLRRFLDGRPTLARPLKWAGRAVRWLRRNDQVVALVVVTTVAAVLLAVGAWYMQQARQLKDDQNRVAQEQADRRVIDLNREYSRNVREAFLAWRAGENKASADALDTARRITSAGGESNDFALQFLAILSQEKRLHIVCPNGPVTALAVTVDGRRLASGHTDGTVAIWDRETGKRIGAVAAHDAEIAQLAFALGGTKLLSVGRSRTGTQSALSWNIAAEGSLAASAESERMLGRQVVCLAVSPDGNSCFFGTEQGELSRVDLANSRRSRTITFAPVIAITALCASPDGKRVLAGTRRGKVMSYTSALELEPGFNYDIAEPIRALAYAPGGGIWAGTRDGIYSSSGEPSLMSTGDRVDWMLPTSEGVAAPDKGRVLFRSTRVRELPTGDTGKVRAAAATRDGETLFTAGDDGIIRSWHLANDIRARGAWSGHGASALGIDPEGRSIVVASPQSLICDFGRAGERVIPGSYRALQVNKAHGRLGLSFESQFAVMSEWVPGQSPKEKWRFALPGGSHPVSADFSSNCERVAVGDDRGQVHIWNTTNGHLVSTIDCGNRNAVRRFILSSDGKFLAAATTNGLGIWEVEKPAAVITTIPESAAVFCFLPGGERIATASETGVIRIWTVESVREEFTLFGHIGRVTALGVSPDGRNLVSGGADGTVKFWDLRSGQELLDMKRHSEPVTTAKFSDNGKLLVTAGITQVAVWEVPD